jgi:hypothetical protein
MLYALMESTKKEVKEKFYDQLEKCIKKLKYTCTIITGDFNAQIGKTTISTNNKTSGKIFLHDTTNKNDNMLLDFCNNNLFLIAYTSQHLMTKLWTWQVLRVN